MKLHMKHIKEYINESLFDDEEDLIDRRASQEILVWFESRTKIFYRYPNLRIVAAKDILEIVSDKVCIKIPESIQYIEFYEQPPKWIKFDEKSWKTVNSIIYYDVTSQKDIERIPQTVFGHIVDFINQKTQNITLDSHANIRSKNLKNIKCNFIGIINVSPIDIKQLTEIKFTRKSTNNALAFSSTNLGMMMIKEYDKLGKKKFIEKYKVSLSKMKANNVFKLIFGLEDSFVL